MKILFYIINITGMYWYVVIPEIIFLLVIGMRFAGPWALVLVAGYFIGLVINPAVTMSLVATLILIDAAYLLIRNVTGDIIAKNKEPESDSASNGVPRLSGQNKDVQAALDEMKREDEKE